MVEQAAVEPEPQKEAPVAETSTAEPAVMNVTTLQFKAEPVETTSEPEEPLLGAHPESETTETVDYLEVVEIVEVVEVDLAQDATTSIDIVDEPAQEDVPAVDISAESSAAEASESNEPPSATGSIGLPKKGRASMPSWDEIVFGTKTED